MSALTPTLLVADYTALEVVILADLCKRLFGDTQLEALTAPGTDIHSHNARLVFGEYLHWIVPSPSGESSTAGYPFAGQRVDAIPEAEFAEHPYGKELRRLIKTVWYGLQYGKGAYGFASLPGADGEEIGEETAQAMLDGIRAMVPGPFSWQEWAREYVDEHRGIYSLGGRWCDLSAETEEAAPEWLRRRAYRRAYNFPMQATGAEIISDAMVRLAASPAWHATGFRVCLQVHDELVARGPLDRVDEAGRILRECMESATANGTRLLVPLRATCGHGPNYYEAK
jgi:DNA polymerase I-like protein with 3'-5' exonuclease and polymerase domains